MAAIDVRLVGLELQANVAAVKTAIDAISAGIDAIAAVTSLWDLTVDDISLPAEADVKTQLLAYEALSISVAKPGNSIGDSINVIKAAV
jgi:hypothetical protein